MVFVFADSPKPIADIDVTGGKGCHSPYSQLSPGNSDKREKHLFFLPRIQNIIQNIKMYIYPSGDQPDC